MAAERTARAEPRPRLSRERVLEAAIALADADGIDGLSMRRLAQELGVEAMSLYHHVSNKDEILNEITDIVVNEFELPPRDEPWNVAIRRTAISAHRSLLRHRWAASLLLSGTTPNLARLRYMDALLGTLRRAGFSAEMTDHAYHALESHIMGFTLWLVGMDLPSDFDALAASFLERLPRDQFPHLAEHVEQHLKPKREGEGEFEFGLDLILSGLRERHR